MSRSRFACLAALALAGMVAIAGPGERVAALPLTDLGVYRGAGDPEAVAEFGRWLGRDPSWALDFLPGDSWRSLARPRWWADRWASSPYKVVYSVPLLPTTGATLQKGAAGAYDGYFTQLARGLAGAGEGDAVIRLGWEFNGDWFPWSASGKEAAFVAYWRRAVDAMRSVAGTDFRFDWCPSAGRNAMDPSTAFPGDDYVDYVGLDVYDATNAPTASPEERWQTLRTEPFGLDWHAAFAEAHDKPMTFPEWGLWLDDEGRGGGDDPYFVEQMWRWTAGHDVAYQMYFDYDADHAVHELDDPALEQSSRRYRDLFGLIPVPARPQP